MMMRALVVSAYTLFVCASMLIMGSTLVGAQFKPLDPACNGAAQSSEVCDPTTPDPITGDDGVIIKAANLLSIVGGFIAIIIIVISGLRMITSGGDSNKVRSSRDAIIYTVVGVIVIVFARTLVEFIFGRIIGS